MLRQTFMHIPGIGQKTESRLWQDGIDDWRRVDPDRLNLGPKRRQLFVRYLERSQSELESGNARFFADNLPAGAHWRLLPEFRPRVAYLDIETTGLMQPMDHITTIALYDGHRVRHYVHGQNLDQFVNDIAGYDLLVTYNGKCFDVPCLESPLGRRLPPSSTVTSFGASPVCANWQCRHQGDGVSGSERLIRPGGSGGGGVRPKFG